MNSETEMNITNIKRYLLRSHSKESLELAEFLWSLFSLEHMEPTRFLSDPDNPINMDMIKEFIIKAPIKDVLEILRFIEENYDIRGVLGNQDNIAMNSNFATCV